MYRRCLQYEHKYLLAAIALSIALFVCTSCEGSSEFAVIIDSDKTPQITVTDREFDCTAAECIEIVNKELENRNLDSADTKYDEKSDGNVTIYISTINEKLELIMMSFSEVGSGISLLQIKCTTDVDDDYEATPDYFQALTSCVCPEFNVKGFMRTGSEGFKYYDYNGLRFQFDEYEQELIEHKEETVGFYYITTAQDEYRKYSDAIFELYEDL